MARENAGEAAKRKAAEEAAKKTAAEKKAAEAAAAAAAKGNKIVKVPALSVVSSREGFRRGGRAWSKTETVVKLSELSKEQIAQIKGDELLAVTDIEVDEEVAAE